MLLERAQAKRLQFGIVFAHPSSSDCHPSGACLLSRYEAKSKKHNYAHGEI
jgi:hypothetical protein